MNNRQRFILIAVALLAAAALGYFAATTHTAHEPAEQKAPAAPAEAWYTCPMHPEVRSHDPNGHCPICGMSLVPLKAADTKQNDSAGVVHVDPAVVQNLGIRTAPVREGRLAQSLRAVGSIVADERRIETIEARAAGWVERLEVGATGEPVRRGQLLAQIYSPDLLAAQEELVLALKSSDAALADAARQRLGRFGVGKAQLDELEQTRKPARTVSIHSPVDGIVLELGTRVGAQVTPGAAMFRLVDLSSVWLTVSVPESQAGAVHAGDTVEARVTAVPGRIFRGKLEYVYPSLAADSRTLAARALLENPGLELKPGMYADLSIATAAGGEQKNGMLVPADAVIRTGTRNVVIVAEGEGRFRPVEVTIGTERGDDIEVLSGLMAGQSVVTSGQFLIDSEAGLRGVLDRLAPAAPSHEHGGHDGVHS